MPAEDMLPDKVIFDTNIFVSLAINRQTKLIVDLFSESGTKLIICPELIAELEEVLSRPKFIRYKIDIDVLISLIQLFSISMRIKERRSNLPDSDDNFLIDLALTASAPIIVTGDKELLKANTHLGITFVSLIEFKREASF